MMGDELKAFAFNSSPITHHYLTILLSRLDRQPGVLPCLHAAEQGRCVFKSVLLEYQRRTGARVFSRSRTVSDNHLIVRQFAQMIGHFA
jgi:hypothetical protein